METSRGIILVVDDSPLVLEMVRDSLQDGGYRALTARSWVEMNHVLKADRPDLILLDLRMPSIDGENLCQILKQSASYGELPVVLFSGLEEEEIQAMAGASGADGWIRKRMGPGEILEDVEREFHRLVGRTDPAGPGS